MLHTKDQIIAEIADTYHIMSLLELLAEENMVATFLQRKGSDPVRETLQKILRAEIGKRLR